MRLGDYTRMIALSFLAALAAASVSEYVTHRWWMHRRGTSYHRSHAVEHHGLGRNEPHHMGFNLRQLFQAWAVSLPAQLLVYALGLSWFPVAWTIVLAWWFLSWEAIHRAIHAESGYAWAAWTIPWFRWSCRHHLAHHQRVSRNFGMVFPWTDRMFGTH
ncbi:MAG TPA: sterol desaturase family protein [Pirellulaceae bacterium]|nr:sterol desaturase family protein [Pirellulaceae bacterium]